jgi:hypothetical protein
LSSVTFNNSNNNNEVLDDIVDMENVDDNVEENNAVAIAEEEAVSESRGSKKIKLTKEQILLNTKIAIFIITSKYQEAKLKAKSENTQVCNGTMAELIQSTLLEYNLPDGIISKKTIESRIRRNNITGIAHQRQSPLIEIEPMLVEWCHKMAKIGMALNKTIVLELANKIIIGTTHASKLETFKKKQKVKTRENNKVVVVDRWYRGFFKRNKKELIKGRCRVKDQKRRTWCTYKHFSNMYEGVY